MRARALSSLAVAAVVAVAVAAAVDSLRGEDAPVTAAPGASAAPAPRDCIDSRPCFRRLQEQVAFYRACVASWNEPANRANRAAVAEGGFDQATLFRSGRERCSLHLVSSESGRIRVARRLEVGWLVVGGGRRPPAADDFAGAFAVALRPDGTLSLRGGQGPLARPSP